MLKKLKVWLTVLFICQVALKLTLLKKRTFELFKNRLHNAWHNRLKALPFYFFCLVRTSNDFLQEDCLFSRRVGMIYIHDIYPWYISDIYPIFSTLKISNIFDIFVFFCLLLRFTNNNLNAITSCSSQSDLWFITVQYITC